MSQHPNILDNDVIPYLWIVRDMKSLKDRRKKTLVAMDQHKLGQKLYGVCKKTYHDAFVIARAYQMIFLDDELDSVKQWITAELHNGMLVRMNYEEFFEYFTPMDDLAEKIEHHKDEIVHHVTMMVPED